MFLPTCVRSPLVAASLLVLATPAPAQDLQIASQATQTAVLPFSSTTSAPTSVSTDGRFVIYDSNAPDVVPGDTNGLTDVFLRDRTQGTNERISVASAGSQGNGASFASSMSADARLVVFQSAASNLVAGDTNGFTDVFLRDRVAGTTVRLSLAPGGAEANGASTNPVISADGRFVAFTTVATNLFAGDSNNFSDVMRLDLATNELTLAHRNGSTFGNGGADFASISADGRFVLFASGSNNLVAGDTNGLQDLFRFDAQTGTTIRVSLGASGAQLSSASFASPGVALSADGQRALFLTAAAALPTDTDTLSDAYVRDLATATTLRATEGLSFSAAQPTISPDGLHVCYSAFQTIGDETFNRLFVRTLGGGVQSLLADAPLDPITVQCGAFSSDGLFVHAIHAVATPGNPTDLQVAYRIEVATGAGELLARRAANVSALAANGASRGGPIGLSDDGTLVAFASAASNLVAGDTNDQRDIFVRDLVQGTTQRISLGAGGAQADCRSRAPRISRNGRYVVFQSCAGLLPVDTNAEDDIYVFDRQSGTLALASIADGGAVANGRSTDPSVANDGTVVFGSCASNLVDGDTNGVCDAFVRAPNGVVLRIAPPLVQPNNGSGAVRISASGRLVAFSSLATNLVGNDTNNQRDIFVFDRQTDAVERVNVGPLGLQANAASNAPEFAGEGRFVTFTSAASNLNGPALASGVVGLFVRDRQNNTTTLLSRSADGSTAFNGNTLPTHRMSDDGTLVGFCTTASNAFPAPSNTVRTRCVRRNNQTGVLTLVSAGLGGADPDNNSTALAMSANGATVVFDSFAPNLVASDANGRVPDLFVFGAPAGPPLSDPVFANGFEAP
jgi:Tol biopolymer transport system component